MVQGLGIQFQALGFSLACFGQDLGVMSDKLYRVPGVRVCNLEFRVGLKAWKS